MTILATHFTVVLGAWRLRIRIDVDEPREAELDERRPPAYVRDDPEQHAREPRVGTWGRG